MSDRLLPGSTYPFIYLASESLRRQELRRQFSLTFERLLPRPKEDTETLDGDLAGGAVDDYMLRMCLANADAARGWLVPRTLPAAPVLARYVASRKSFGKAGAYAIQGRSAEFVKQINSPYSGIMNLPLFEATALLCSAHAAV
ncbi:MAG: Maf family protein [Burkholderia sp.]